MILVIKNVKNVADIIVKYVDEKCGCSKKCAHVSTTKKGAHVSTKLIFLSVFLIGKLAKDFFCNNLVTGLFVHRICNPVLPGWCTN